MQKCSRLFSSKRKKENIKRKSKTNKQGKKKEKESSKTSNHDRKWQGSKIGTPFQDCRHHLTIHHFNDDINTLE